MSVAAMMRTVRALSPGEGHAFVTYHDRSDKGPESSMRVLVDRRMYDAPDGKPEYDCRVQWMTDDGEWIDWSDPNSSDYMASGLVMPLAHVRAFLAFFTSVVAGWQ